MNPSELSEFDPHATAKLIHNWEYEEISFILRADLRHLTEYFISGEFTECLQLCNIVIDYVWEKLNTGHWSDIKDLWRYIYYASSMYKALCQLRLGHNLQASVTSCDMGLLMGLRPSGWSFSLTDLASKLSKHHTSRPTQKDENSTSHSGIGSSSRCHSSRTYMVCQRQGIKNCESIEEFSLQILDTPPPPLMFKFSSKFICQETLNGYVSSTMVHLDETFYSP